MLPCGKLITPDPNPLLCTEDLLCYSCLKKTNQYQQISNGRLCDYVAKQKEIIYHLLKYIHPKCVICRVPATRECRFDECPNTNTYYCDAHRRTEDEFNNGHKTFIARYIDLPVANIIREAMKVINV